MRVKVQNDMRTSTHIYPQFSTVLPFIASHFTRSQIIIIIIIITIIIIIIRIAVYDPVKL